MAYFNYFPKIGYDVRGDKNNVKLDLVVNLLKRVRKKIEIINISFFEQHFIQDGERADTIAYKLYNDSTLHWLILYANYITNPYYDWPMTYLDLQQYISKKYGPVGKGGNGLGMNGIHHYEDSSGNEVDAPGTIVTSDGLTAGSATPITNYKYEEFLNDSKRTIDIIRYEYVSATVEEFKTLIIK